ncbi:MAG: flavodoxin family protein [Spirochaetes bacterium]|nr:flavodoxin family protein [Spirochaetota bacterium]MBU1081690.1 flavodoxin family protein [Spirochaetota bacterium]
MKVIAINGSPKEKGNTFTAIDAVFGELRNEGIECEIIHVGDKAVRGCIGCGQCRKNRDGKCALKDDGVNGWIERMRVADGLLLGSPVYFSAIAGTMKCFLDRAFYVAGSNGGLFRHKVGASVVADRRAGGVAAFDQLNHYVTYAEMFMPGSCYWNVAFGGAAGEALQDEEGMQAMRVLGRNMAWLLRTKESGSLALPEAEKKAYFSYIR